MAWRFRKPLSQSRGRQRLSLEISHVHTCARLYDGGNIDPLCSNSCILHNFGFCKIPWIKSCRNKSCLFIFIYFWFFKPDIFSYIFLLASNVDVILISYVEFLGTFSSVACIKKISDYFAMGLACHPVMDYAHENVHLWTEIWDVQLSVPLISNEQPFTQPQQTGSTKRKEKMKKLLKSELLNGNSSPGVENSSSDSVGNSSGSIGDGSTGKSNLYWLNKKFERVRGSEWKNYSVRIKTV